MAEVYKAYTTANPDNTLAIKRTLPQFTEHKELISMLVNEARLSMGLSHPNIVPVLDFGVVDETYFIAMEFMDGKDLKSVMTRLKARKNEISIPMAIHILSQVLRGLDYAHHKCDNYNQPLQIVHRDISPQNIMISFSGQVKILDFGIAKAASKTSSTQVGVLKGKFCYMSPEQSMGKDVDPRTDIFAAGIVLWELLTLQNYFQGKNDMDLLKNVRKAHLRDPSQINIKVPPELATIVLRALEKKPKKRYQTAGEFANALDNYQYDRFGSVSAADIGAFVRNLYAVNVSEAEASDLSIDTSAGTMIPGIGDKPQPELKDSRDSFKRAPWAEDKVPTWIWWFPMTLGVTAMIGWALWVFPPKKIFEVFDNQAIRIASLVHRIYNPSPKQPPGEIHIYSPKIPQPTYMLEIPPQVKTALEDLPFETYEQVRDHISDLAFKPFTQNSQSVAKRPGTWITNQAGFRVTYRVNNVTKTVTVEKLEKMKK